MTKLSVKFVTKIAIYGIHNDKFPDRIIINAGQKVSLIK